MSFISIMIILVLVMTISVSTLLILKSKELNSGDMGKHIKRFRGILSLIVEMSTVLSMILVYFTLLEMQKERDNAYRPNIVLANKVLDLNLGKRNDDGMLETVLVDSENWRSIMPQLNACNIGVGAAEHVEIKFDVDSVSALFDYHNSIRYDDMPTMKVENDVYKMYVDDNRCFSYRNKPVKFSYILTNDTIDGIFLPTEIYATYIDIMTYKLNDTMIKRGSTSLILLETIDMADIPEIRLNVKYSDIQGKEYADVLYFTIDNERSYTWGIKDEDVIYYLDFDIHK